MSQAMHCSRCGHDNPGGSRFCNQCGQSLTLHAQPYTPKFLADKVLTRRAALEGEHKQVTVMFVDVKGSVALSRKLKSEAWHRTMDRFFAILGEAIHTQEGTINQYTGDGVMALFGAPIAHEDHAQRACIAALAIRDSLRDFAAELAREHGIEFSVRTGLNSGEVVVGRIGDDLRMDYTAKGQTVGLAARMEQIAQPGRIYLTEYTARLLQGRFDLRRRAEERVKGLRDKVNIHELRGLARYRNRFDRLREEGRLTAFINRKAELACLTDALAQARQGAGSVVLVRAPNGMGKSRLVYELAQHARNEGLPVYEIHALHQHRGAPLQPFLDFLRNYLNLDEDADAQALRVQVERRLARLGMAAYLPQALQLLQLSGADEDSALRSAPGELFALLRAGLAAGAMADPGVLIIENLQLLEASPDVAAFIDDVVRAAVDSSTLLVATVGLGYQPRWPARHLQLLDLQPLEAGQSQALAQELLGRGGESAQLMQWLAERGGGNPLFMEETLSVLLESGVLERTRKGVKQLRDLDDVQLPAEVQAMIAARIDQLDEPVKRLLQVAAVVGRQVDVQTLADVLQEPSSRLRKVLKALVEDGWLYEDGRERYSFHQSLVRDVAYAALLQDRRQQLHRQVAESLAQRAERDERGLAPIIAQHYIVAGDPVQAMHWHVRAAEWARHRDLGVALRHWLQVVELARSCAQTDTAQQGLELKAIAQALYIGARSGLDGNLHDELVQRGDELCARLTDAAQGNAYRLARVNDLLAAGDMAAALELAQLALSHAPDAENRVAAQVRLAHVQLLRGDLPATLEHCRQGLELSGTDCNVGVAIMGRSAYLDLATMQARALGLQGEWRRAAADMDKLLARAGDWPFRDQYALLLLVAAQLQFEIGHRPKSERLAGQALRLAVQSGNHLLAMSVHIMQARLLLHARRLEEADALLSAGLQHGEEATGYGGESISLLALKAQLLNLQGRHAAAFELAKRAARQARNSPAPLAALEAHLALALALGLRGRRLYHSSVEAELKSATALIEQCGAHGLTYRVAYVRGLMLWLRGDKKGAATSLAQARAALTQLGLNQAARALRWPGE